MLLNDVEHMTRHVQQRLMLAEVSEEQNYKLSSTKIKDVAHEVASFLDPMAQKRVVKINLSTQAKIIWNADSAALFVLLKNLLENAIQHAPQGTVVEIATTASSIAIRDYGSGVTDEQKQLLFERFWRGPHKRDTGAGLGLSICKEIAQAHNWEIQCKDASPGLLVEVMNKASLKENSDPDTNLS